MAVNAELRGALEARQEMDRIVRDMHGAPMLDAMRDATLWVTGDARRDSPVDMGKLRASIVPEVKSEGREVIGIVGSNVVYAPYVEFGTKPHWPPRAALEVWARRHGTTAYVVARAIARRGTKAHRMLSNALANNAGRIFRRLGDGFSAVVRGR